MPPYGALQKHILYFNIITILSVELRACTRVYCIKYLSKVDSSMLGGGCEDDHSQILSQLLLGLQGLGELWNEEQNRK